MIIYYLVFLSMFAGINMRLQQSGIITRAQWSAKPPKEHVELINKTLPLVIIHHTYIPGACNTTEDCKRTMRSMQNYHQDDRGWNDIGYNFCVGGDGLIYEGRGFNIVGAHTLKYNTKSVGICLIGDWRTELPSPRMLKAAKELIAIGVAKGYIDSQYELIGARQARPTESPGDRLFSEISTWKHFSHNFEPINID